MIKVNTNTEDRISVGEQHSRVAMQHSQASLEMAADQFEAMFLQMVLKQMRASSDAISSDSVFSSKKQDLFRGMLDVQLAQEIAEKQNVGVSKMIMKQLQPSSAAFQQPILPVRKQS